MKYLVILVAASFVTACASDDNGRGRRSGRNDDREPASYNRAGRPIDPNKPRVMNHRRLDMETIYQNCIKERPEVYCRNRTGY